MPMTLLAAALLPWLGAALLFGQRNDARDRCAWLAGAVVALAIAALVASVPAVAGGDIVRVSWPWLPTLGVNFGFRLDGLALMFAGLVLGIGLVIVLYARYYLAEGEPIARFYGLLLTFMGAMQGMVLADNLILLVVFWELTGLSSFLLIGFWSQRADARQGARMALAITGGGGLALLAGVVLIGSAVGSYDLDAVLAAGPALHAHPYYLPALVLVLLGAFTKSAQFPFHFWLPQAMAAPTPVSAYLHSATLVKAGVFLLARLYPALGGSDAWFYLVSAAGVATLLLGAVLALFQHDIKGLLAYSTISHLGLITLLFGLDRPLAMVAGVFHIVNHATFKASLFMAAGIIDHESGSRDMRRLHGLYRYMPHTATLAMTAAAAMAGVPLLNGFLSKEMFFAETLLLGERGALAWALPAVATLAGLFSVAYSVRFIHDVFFNGTAVDLPRTPHEPPRWMRVPVELLVLVCLLVGVLPGLTVAPLLHLAAGAAYGGELPPYSLGVWHGLNLPLLMSVLALVGGVAVYVGLHRWVDMHTLELTAYSGKAAFERLLAWLLAGAGRVTRWIDDGRLGRYMALLLLAAIAAGAWPLWRHGYQPGDVAGQAMPPIIALIWLVGLLAAVIATLLHRQRLVAVILLGIAGLVVGLAFVYLSAPDLALTQILIEMASLLLLLLALGRLPHDAPAEPVARRLRDAGIALLAGGGVTALLYGVLTRPTTSISEYFLGQAYPLGGGRNVVNVIIVDFRGFDTLGEIAVLALAGLIVHAVLRRLRRAPRPQAGLASDRHPLLLTLLSGLLLPLASAVAVFLLLRGHNLPGGGFIAGLVLALALLVQYLARGSAWVDARLHTGFEVWIAAGLLLAGLTGVAAWLFGHPFLTSTTAHPVLPLLGELPLASAMAFDLGVFAVVVGATLLALLSLARRQPRGAG
nr:monovalent cation/H+ antiporter subunit A [Immundisolibacter cernigliae]